MFKGIGNVFFYIFFGISGIIGLYLLVRVFSYGVFLSYNQAKERYLKDKGGMLWLRREVVVGLLEEVNRLRLKVGEAEVRLEEVEADLEEELQKGSTVQP